MTEPAPGATLGRFQLRSILGRGAFGTVHAADDATTGERVALKVLRGAGPAAEAQLLAEAQLMARVASPHVVRVLEVARLDGALCVAMELVEGTTVARWLRAAPRAPAAVVDAFAQAARGLADAHAVGVVHRDVKPENLLIDGRGRVAVSDFGLARAQAGGAGAGGGAMIGTPAYMAPEALGGEEVDARADVFALCVGLHEALFGEHPFPAATLLEMLGAILRGPRLPADAAARVPAHVLAALAGGLRADRRQRLPSMAALLAALGAA